MSTCPVCLDDDIDKKFNCSHGTCSDCYKELVKNNLNTCPICRAEIFTKRETGEKEYEITITVIYRRRRRDLTYEEKLINRQRSRAKQKRKWQRKDGRRDKFINHHF